MLILFLTVILLIRPSGDFPLGDDWQYAVIAKRLADTGVFSAAPPVAPSLILQSLLGAIAVKIVGFSHLHLRELTWICSALLILVLDSLLVLAGVTKLVRTVAAMLLIVNPLYQYLSNSFMSEIYGYLVALLSVLVWFRGFFIKADGPEVKWISWIFSAILAGLAFWTRQFCCIIFPALVFSFLFASFLSKTPLKTKQLLAKILISSTIYLSLIFSYFVWARASGNFSIAFQKPLARLGTIDLGSWHIEFVLFWIYMSAYFMPLLCPFFFLNLLSLNGPILRSNGKALLGGWYLYAAVGYVSIWLTVNSHQTYGWLLHLKFPNLGIILNEGGIGPITLADVYNSNQGNRPILPGFFWYALEALLFILSSFWLFLYPASLRRVRENPRNISSHLTLFGAFFSLLSLASAIQTYKSEIFERYHFGAFFGVWIVLIITLDGYFKSPDSVRVDERKFSLLILPGIILLAVFTVTGLHDYFAWNEVRWEMVNGIIKTGVPTEEIDGGFEVDGWLKFYETSARGYVAQKRAPLVNCDFWYYCPRKYKISMNDVPGYERIKSSEVQTWLTSIPPLLLLKRN